MRTGYQAAGEWTASHDELMRASASLYRRTRRLWLGSTGDSKSYPYGLNITSSKRRLCKKLYKYPPYPPI